MKKNWIFLIVLIVLVLISAIQAIQLSDIKTKISSGESATVSYSLGSGGSGQEAASTPKSLQNLPQMVGGC